MAETKLDKVNKRLYHEPYKEGKPFKWAKRLRSLFVTLNDARVDLCLSIERPENSWSQSWEDLEKEREDHQKAEQENMMATKSEKEEDEKYSENFAWRIVATGRLDDRIGLIRKDGTVTDHLEHFERVDVILRPISDTDKEKAYGHLFYSDAKLEKRAEPYLSLELFVPETRFTPLCNEIVSGRLSALQVGVDVDVFQSEVDSSLWEPPMLQRFYIEEDEIYNRAYLSWLAASRNIASGPSGADDTNNRSSPFNEVFSAQTETLRVIKQHLASIRVVGILIVLVLLLMLLLK